MVCVKNSWNNPNRWRINFIDSGNIGFLNPFEDDAGSKFRKISKEEKKVNK